MDAVFDSSITRMEKSTAPTVGSIWFEPVSTAPEDTKLPTRKTRDSAGYDMYLTEDVVLKPHGFTKIIPLNIKAYMPHGYYLALHIRSSVGILKHITLANKTGIIDADYCDNPENEGNIGITLHNESDRWIRLHKGDRIVQGIFQPYNTVYNDNVTNERKGATGSTGV